MPVSGLFNQYQLYRVRIAALPAPLPIPLSNLATGRICDKAGQSACCIAYKSVAAKNISHHPDCCAKQRALNF
jgi:hypothetical protein